MRWAMTTPAGTATTANTSQKTTLLPLTRNSHSTTKQSAPMRAADWALARVITRPG